MRAFVVAVVLGAIAVGCGEDAERAAREVVDREQAARRAKVERAVRAGRLPPVALKLFRPDGTVDISFVDGPNADRDLVRTSDGSLLRWDLDGDGRIGGGERRITERELYDATLGLP